jgi:chorismate dehydratase
MVRIIAVSYLNTAPFIYGLKQSKLIDSINLTLDYPAACADKLINGEVDIALVPIVVIPTLKEAHVISNYCIGANGAVDTVCLYSDVPISKIANIFLDYQSKTSVALLKILLKEYWHLNPKLKSTEPGFEEDISGVNAALVIGDRAFDLNKRHKYIYDLSDIWKEMTGFPFVFAAWVANKRLSSSFILEFNKALENGLKNIHNSIEKDINFSNCDNPINYLDNKISYKLDSNKLKGMNLFLKKI